MEKQEAITLFHSMYPNFFEKEYIQSLLEDSIFDEMLLRLEEFDTHKYEKTLDTCARKLFNEISTENVVYHDVDSYQRLLNIMDGIEKKKC